MHVLRIGGYIYDNNTFFARQFDRTGAREREIEIIFFCFSFDCLEFSSAGAVIVAAYRQMLRQLNVCIHTPHSTLHTYMCISVFIFRICSMFMAFAFMQIFYFIFYFRDHVYLR